MNPADNPVQGDNDALKKLELDLQKLEQDRANSGMNTFKSTIPTPPPTEPTSKPKSNVLGNLFLLIVGLLILLAAGYGLKANYFSQKACTLEAKICPNGTSVGRTGPNCEFAECSTAATPDPTVNWKTFSSDLYQFSFKHPNMDDKCCGLAGAISNNPKGIIVVADASTVVPNTDAPFDGISIYVIEKGSMTLSQYVEKEKVALKKQSEIMGDAGQVKTGKVIETEIAGQNAISLVDYSWDGVIRTYLEHPNGKYFIEVSKKEQSTGHFKLYNQILSTFKFTVEKVTPQTNMKRFEEKNSMIPVYFDYPQNLNITNLNRGATEGADHIFIDDHVITIPEAWDSPLATIEAYYIYPNTQNYDSYEGRLAKIKEGLEPQTIKEDPINSNGLTGTIVSGTMVEGYWGGVKMVQAIIKTVKGPIVFQYFGYGEEGTPSVTEATFRSIVKSVGPVGSN
ncbi:MAG: hypothetical protein ACHQUA_01435 [Microgenomates group bacterium]